MELKRRLAKDKRAQRIGFTLVELLVVITIIGILVGLIGVAAARALKTARQSQIKTELDQISMAFDTFRDTYVSYPPNCQVDDQTENTGAEPGSFAISELQVITNLRRQMKAFPRGREPDDLIRVLAGLTPTDSSRFPRVLAGGMTAGEAIVFWLGGFSADPKYPISGEGGPSYVIPGLTGAASNAELDPLDRKWIFPFKVTRLEPRVQSTNFFDQQDNRFIEYSVTVNGVQQFRRINFWQYVPEKSDKPYLYFDTSRHPAVDMANGSPLATYDPPAATALTGRLASQIFAIKKAGDQVPVSPDPRVDFANKDKFQILHAGVDEEWGDFTRMSAATVADATSQASYLLFPNGPFTGEVADTIVNFSTNTLEGSQP